MKITHVISAQFPVAAYGGTERAAYWLGKAQAELGHEVSYLCKPGSEFPFAKALPLPEQISDITPMLPPGTDFVQFYSTPSYRCDAPYLVCIQGNGQAGEQFLPNTVFVSANHANRHGWTEFVHNGIDLEDYPMDLGKKELGALFLAKASWSVKNLKGSIRIAKAAGVPLHIAGGRAACWHRGVISHGMVGGQTKLDLIQKTEALLFPVIWDEPFGIAIIEVLACGAPVIATPRGSLPEIVDSTCGALADSFDGLVAGLMNRKKFDPEACRARVENFFSHRKMAEKYLFYYEKIRRDGKLREGSPATPKDADPEKKIYYQDY